MIQAVPLRRAHVPILAVAAVVLAALAALGAPTFSQSSSAPARAVVEFAPTPALRPAVVQQSIASSCGNAYVTGDMVGDASPAAVYGTLCSGR